MEHLPSWKLTYPIPRHFWVDDFSRYISRLVRYVSSLQGTPYRSLLNQCWILALQEVTLDGQPSRTNGRWTGEAFGFVGQKYWWQVINLWDKNTYIYISIWFEYVIYATTLQLHPFIYSFYLYLYGHCFSIDRVLHISYQCEVSRTVWLGGY